MILSLSDEVVVYVARSLLLSIQHLHCGLICSKSMYLMFRGRKVLRFTAVAAVTAQRCGFFLAAAVGGCHRTVP